MPETLVKVENVSKKFCRDLKRGLWYGVKDLGNEIIAKSNHRNKLRSKEFWAVRDVTFELKRGECLGLIGHNGAGKSTLLKMLNGLIKPDTGRIEMHGRVGALIELGAGFNPILTGRENIYINGAVLGFTKKEIDQKLESILAFAEIDDFIDTPVQYYSSGMKVRLGFAVAAQMEPDVLIIDEVLSVGDAGFKIKSFNKISELMRSSAVIFVSHSMPQISRVSNKIMYMRNGKTEFYGNMVNEGIQAYFENFQGEKSNIEYNGGANIEIIEVYDHLTPAEGENIPIICYTHDLCIRLEIFMKSECPKFDLIMQITDKDMKIVAQFLSSKHNGGFYIDNNNRKKILLRFPRVLFVDGEYSITIFLTKNNSDDPSKYSFLAVYRHIKKFKMQGLGEVLYAPIHLDCVVNEESAL